MNLGEPKYGELALCRDMMETVGILKGFTGSAVEEFVRRTAGMKGLFLTGEGSSRIFPAKNLVSCSFHASRQVPVFTEGASQAREFNLADLAVFGASNSGKTSETIKLFQHLKKTGHPAFFGLTAAKDSPLQKLSCKTHVLSCGKEGAVAATKSVVEQALFYKTLYTRLEKKPAVGRSIMMETGENLKKVLEMKIDSDIIRKIASARIVYFSGRNDGVAEELSLKTNEIAGKMSHYLEGTSAVHGIEEVMKDEDVMIVINPFEDEEQKIKETFSDRVGLPVFAIASRETSFPTVLVPEGGDFRSYIELAAGWNILVETGISLGVNLDKPVRARKIGNEYE